MKLFHHIFLDGFSNTYVLGSENSSRALVIDPGSMDEELLMLIEDNNFVPAAILLTRNERHHAGGVRTFQRIYNCPVFGRKPPEEHQHSHEITDTQSFTVGGFEVHAIRLPGSWIDGVIYQIGGALFPGPMLSSGKTSDLPPGFAKALLIEGLQTVLESMPPRTYVFPAYGPPTTIQAELGTNEDLRKSPDHHIPRERFEVAPETDS